MDECTGLVPGKGKCLLCLSRQGNDLFQEPAQHGGVRLSLRAFMGNSLCPGWDLNRSGSGSSHVRKQSLLHNFWNHMGVGAADIILLFFWICQHVSLNISIITIPQKIINSVTSPNMQSIHKLPWLSQICILVTFPLPHQGSKWSSYSTFEYCVFVVS